MVYVYAESEGRYPLMVGVFLVSKNHVFCLKTEKYSASMGVNDICAVIYFEVILHDCDDLVPKRIKVQKSRVQLF